MCISLYLILIHINKKILWTQFIITHAYYINNFLKVIGDSCSNVFLVDPSTSFIIIFSSPLNDN